MLELTRFPIACNNRTDTYCVAAAAAFAEVALVPDGEGVEEQDVDAGVAVCEFLLLLFVGFWCCCLYY